MVGPPTLISKSAHRHATDQCDRSNSSIEVPASWADLDLCQVDKLRKPINLESSILLQALFHCLTIIVVQLDHKVFWNPTFPSIFGWNLYLSSLLSSSCFHWLIGLTLHSKPCIYFTSFCSFFLSYFKTNWANICWSISLVPTLSNIQYSLNKPYLFR